MSEYEIESFYLKGSRAPSRKAVKQEETIVTGNNNSKANSKQSTRNPTPTNDEVPQEVQQEPETEARPDSGKEKRATSAALEAESQLDTGSAEGKQSPSQKSNNLPSTNTPTLFHIRKTIMHPI